MFGPPPPKRPIGPKLAINPLVDDENEEISCPTTTGEESVPMSIAAGTDRENAAVSEKVSWN